MTRQRAGESALLVFVALAVVACHRSPSVYPPRMDAPAGTDSNAGTGGSGGTGGARFDGGPDEAESQGGRDGGNDINGPDGTDGVTQGPIPCGTSVCNNGNEICVHPAPGETLIGPDGGPLPDNTDLTPFCVAIPSRCLSAPTCDCFVYQIGDPCEGRNASATCSCMTDRHLKCGFLGNSFRGQCPGYSGADAGGKPGVGPWECGDRSCGPDEICVHRTCGPGFRCPSSDTTPFCYRVPESCRSAACCDCFLGSVPDPCPVATVNAAVVCNEIDQAHLFCNYGRQSPCARDAGAADRPADSG